MAKPAEFEAKMTHFEAGLWPILAHSGDILGRFSTVFHCRKPREWRHHGEVKVKWSAKVFTILMLDHAP
jgi:hypothetical protein